MILVTFCSNIEIFWTGEDSMLITSIMIMVQQEKKMVQDNAQTNPGGVRVLRSLPSLNKRGSDFS